MKIKTLIFLTAFFTISTFHAYGQSGEEILKDILKNFMSKEDTKSVQNNTSYERQSIYQVGNVQVTRFGFADDDYHVKSISYMNGYEWNRLTRQVTRSGDTEWIDTLKAHYIRGIYDGVSWANPLYAQDQYIVNASYREMIDKVDDFYDVYRNQPIALPDALHIIAMKEKGAAKEKISTATEKARKRYRYYQY